MVSRKEIERRARRIIRRKPEVGRGMLCKELVDELSMGMTPVEILVLIQAILQVLIIVLG